MDHRNGLPGRSPGSPAEAHSNRCKCNSRVCLLLGLVNLLQVVRQIRFGLEVSFVLASGGWLLAGVVGKMWGKPLSISSDSRFLGGRIM